MKSPQQRCEERPWEEKRIDLFSSFEYADMDDNDMRLHCRDWLLSGEHFEWKFWKDTLTGEYVLQRR